MEDFLCNVLVMGKTGVGKSSLLNYIFGSKVAATGVGKPVTGQGLYEYLNTVDGKNVRIYDSWGIEAGKVKEWEKLISDELKKHGVHKEMKDWFHSVIYCIQAGGSRTEDIDIRIINSFLENNYKVVIALTKADQIEKEEGAQMKKAIWDSLSKKQNIRPQIVEVCSGGKTRSGASNPFGRKDLVCSMYDGWKQSVIERIPKHIVERLCLAFDDFFESNKKFDEFKRELSGIDSENNYIYEFIADEIKSYLTEKVQEDLQLIAEDVKKALQGTEHFFGNLYDIGSISYEDRLADTMPFIIETIIAVTPGVNLIKVIINNSRRHSNGNIREEKKRLRKYLDELQEDVHKKLRALEGQIREDIKKKL